MAPLKYYDAHLHLQFSELRSLDLSTYTDQVSGAIVNGTSPADWPQVQQLTLEFPSLIPAYGVHPWEVAKLPKNWLTTLRYYLEQQPSATIGEIGLDKWIHGYDLALQKKVFLAQLQLAIELQRPISIHCLRAWGSLLELLEQSSPLPPFLLHAYAGPHEMIDRLTKLGAYFSFSPYFLSEGKQHKADLFYQIPLERLLVETDAPSMLGPPITQSKAQSALPEAVQHPSNIIPTYQALASHLNHPLPELSSIIENNYSSFLNLLR